MSDSHSFTSSLLMTHARFAEVYSLFESIVEQLPEALTKEFINDVDQIRGKLDSWKALFTYEKEKVKFLNKKDRRKSFSDVFSLYDAANVQSLDGSCDYSTDSTCATPISTIQPPRSEATPPPPPSSVTSTTPDNESSTTTPESEIIPSVLVDCLPLVLDNENDETWLSAGPQAALESVQEEEVKQESKTKSPAQKKASFKKPISERIKTSTDWIRTKIPKAPGKSKLRNVRAIGSPVISSPSPAKTKPSRSGRFSVELSTQSETRNHRFHSSGGKHRNTTV
eukprot:g4975.t1